MDAMKIMADVLNKEADAIRTLSNELSQKHMAVLELIEKCQGKIIVTGIGKSGHIARKISATMSSLGTPSLFLHPAEAAHGDLGMVERKDILLMISKSGETDELKQLIPSLKLIGCKIIGLFCKENSTLGRYCDIEVVLPIKEEACINNLAPTTSSTITMAFGDAIAVALSARKNFGREDFALFHPQGNLGKRLLLTVSDIANKNESEIMTESKEIIKNVLWHITKNRLGAVAIVDDQKRLIGLVSDGDIRRAIEKRVDILGETASNVMTTNPIYVKANILAVEAFKLMSNRKISVLPIVDDENRLEGIVSFHDIVAAGIGG